MVDLEKRYAGLKAVDGVTFEVAPGTVMALLGPSGCGKSTALRLVGGLEQPDKGDVRWDGMSVLRDPPHVRGFGLMFQDYALFPHLNVAENVAFGLRYGGIHGDAATRRVEELLDRVGLAGFGRRAVDKLSGGEQQRVALARTLAPNPRLLMLDEPMGALDRALRARLLPELAELLATLRVPTLYVTHDQDEAFVIGTEVAVMNAGRIERRGPPRDVYAWPGSAFVARFLGLGNLVSGRTTEATHEGAVRVSTDLGVLPATVAGHETVAHDAEVTVLIRPEAARRARHGEVELTGTVEAVDFHGATQELSVRLAGHLLTFVVATGGEPAAAGSDTPIALGPETVQILTDHESPRARINYDNAALDQGDHSK